MFLNSILFTQFVFPKYFDELRAMQESMLRAKGIPETMKDDVWTIRYGVASTDVLFEPGYCAVFVIRLPKLGQTFAFDREEFESGG